MLSLVFFLFLFQLSLWRLGIEAMVARAPLAWVSWKFLKYSAVPIFFPSPMHAAPPCYAWPAMVFPAFHVSSFGSYMGTPPVSSKWSPVAPPPLLVTFSTPWDPCIALMGDDSPPTIPRP